MPDVTDVRQAPTAQLPPQYVGPTPAQLKHMYEYSKALTGDAMSPVRHWTQGVGNMVSALMGGWLGNEANKLQYGAEGRAAESRTPQPPAAPTMLTPPSGPTGGDDAPTTPKPALPVGALSFAPEEGSKAKVDSGASGESGLIDRARATTSRQESGGRYDLVGPTSKKYGDALGKYQILEANVRNWGKEILGRDISRQEFLSTPAIQDAIYNGKMAQYIKKHGVEGAGRAWLGGEGGINYPDRRDVLGTSIGDYGRKFAQGVGAGGAPATASLKMPGVPTQPLPFLSSTALPLSAEAPPVGPDGSMPAETAKMVSALAAIDPSSSLPMKGPGAVAGEPGVQLAQAAPGGPRLAPVIPGPRPSPTPAPVNAAPLPTVPSAVNTQWDPVPHLPPAQIPKSPKYTYEQMRQAMGNTAISPAEKEQIKAAYMQQFQPIEIKVPGGTVKVNPLDHSQQKYYPEIQKGTTKLGDMEIQAPYTYDPFGRTRERIPRAGAPVAAPVAPPVAPPAAVRPPPLPNVPVVPVRPGAPAGTPQLTPGMLSPAPIGPQGALPGGPTLAEAPTPPPAPDMPPVRLAAAPTSTMSDAPPIGAAPPMGVGGPSPADIAATPLPIGPPPGVPGGPQVAQVGLPTTSFTLPQSGPPPASVPGASPATPGAGAAVPPPVGVPPGVDPEDWDAYMTSQKQKIQQKGLETSTTKSAENYAARFNEMNKAVGKTREEVVPALQQALAQLDKAQFYSGALADPILWFKRAQGSLAQSFPNLGLDKYAAAPNEVFTKGIAGAILANMQKALEGLGQVCVAEIDLLKQAMASPHNTIESNRTLLNMALRVLERGEAIDTMAQDYAAGADVVNLLSPNKEVLLPATPDGSPRAGGNIDVGFDLLIGKVTKQYPPFTPAEIADQKGVWEKDKAAGAPKEKTYRKPPAAAIQDLRNNPETRDQFEALFGDADKYLKKPKGK